MSNKKDKRLYNYIVNTLGVSRETIMDLIESRLEDLLDRKMGFGYLENRVNEYIEKRIERDFRSEYGWDIRRKIEAEVKKQLESFSVEGSVKITHNPKFNVEVEWDSKK